MKLIQTKIQERIQNNALRSLRDTTDLIDFASNNYLGLERFINILPEDVLDLKPIKQIYNRTGSRLLSGQSSFKSSVEQEIANFHKSESALIFGSGYMANLGLISTIASKHTIILYDQLCHASLRDAFKLSNAKAYSFKHNDINHLKQKLEQFSDTEILVVVEGVYSMDGDSCPLNEIVELKNAYEFNIILDEAHSNGVYGSRGEGLAVFNNAQESIFARIMTFGKALGIHGAAVVGNHELIQFLINFSRPFIYTTAPSDDHFYNILLRYKCLMNNSIVLDQLTENKTYFMKFAKQLDLEITGGASGIFIMCQSGNNKVKKSAQYLQDAGLDVRPILSPTVPKNEERLRICMHAFNTKKEIDHLLNKLTNVK